MHTFENHMTDEVVAIFAPLKEAIEATPHTRLDLLHCISLFMDGELPKIGRAMAVHAAVIDMEVKQSGEPELTYAELIAEMYRRTFFDPHYAKLHGTGDLLEAGPKALKEFAEYLVKSMRTQAEILETFETKNDPEQL